VATPSFVYPADGSVVTTGATRAAATARQARTATSSSTATAANISIFDGEITAGSATAGSTASAGSSSAGGGFANARVSGLQALGRPHAFGRVTLGDWGYLTIAGHSVDRASATGTKGYTGIAAALTVHLTAVHGGLPAGSEVDIGYVETRAQTPRPPEPPVEAGPVPGDSPALLPATTGPLVGVPQIVEPSLAAGPYVFPVYGSSRFADDYGSTTRGLAWDHGVDIFGELGQPLVAVTSGTLYGIGWNRTAGNRLWLRDKAGNEFSYSHLAAFALSSRNGAHVHTGQVVGFMGDTGDLDGEPTHVEFEVHPVSTLFLGPDGAVDPVPYFPSWKRLASLSFPVSTGWAPKVPGTIEAPEPGAALVGQNDISSLDGLDPAALRRALRPSVHG
jgi:murein DD-endopeptidase MepM/ murein hydrolase activator NlpD